MAIAHALAKQVDDLDPDVLQVDEANITGHPHEGDWAADAINIILDAVGTGRATTSAQPPFITPHSSPRTEKAVHLCFGNYGGQSIQHGTWAKLIDFLNRLH